MARIAKLALHPITLLLATALTCHALLPLTDYRCAEDLWLINWVTTRRFPDLYTVYSQDGRLFSGYYFALFSFLPNITTTFKVVGVVLSAATGILAYRLAWRTGFLSRAEALFLAVVMTAFPADKMFGGFMFSKPHTCICAFLAAALLWLSMERRPGPTRWLLRPAALLLFLFSFLTESLLFYFGGFFLLLVLMRQRDAGLPWQRIPWRYCLRRADLLLLPFLYWTALCVFSPSHGNYYAAYNRPEFRLASVAAAYGALPGTLLDPFRLVWSSAWQVQVFLAGLALLAALVIGAAVQRLTRREPSAPEALSSGPAGPRRSLGLFLFGVVLLVLGTLPYVLVNRVFAPWGQHSRYVVLVPLPLGILLLAVGRLLPRSGSRTARTLSWGAHAGVAVCLAAWFATWWSNYMWQEAVQVRNDAMLRKVHGCPTAKDCSLYCVLNLYPLPPAVDDLNSWQWTYAESGATGPARSIAFPFNPMCRPLSTAEVKDVIWLSTIPYALTTIDPAGGQGLLIVRPGTDASAAGLAGDYLYLKYFHPRRLAEFQDRAVKIDFVPAPWDTAAALRLCPAGP